VGADRLQQEILPDEVEARERLVEEYEGWLMQKGEREAESLTLAHREAIDAAGGELAKGETPYSIRNERLPAPALH